MREPRSHWRYTGLSKRTDGWGGRARKSPKILLLVVVVSRSRKAPDPEAAIANPAKLSMPCSVLAVVESAGFIEKGGILNFVLRDDRVQVQITHKAGTQAGLDISSRLLSVAKLVIE